jgi:hypothetical protein
VFQAGDPVEIQLRSGNLCVGVRGKLVQFVRPLMEIHLENSPVCASALQAGAVVPLAISGGTGVYTAEAVVQRYNSATGQVIVSVNGSFRFQQRRQHERYPCRMPVHVRAVGDTDWQNAECCDISAGGARIYLAQEIILRTSTLEIVFLAPGSQQGVRAVAEVVRTSKLLHEAGWELGVRFTEMDRAEKIRFTRLLQYWASVQHREPVQP